MKKGFTLVEMLAVITLLGLLALVIIPASEAIIKNSKNDSYNIQIQNIKNAMKNKTPYLMNFFFISLLSKIYLLFLPLHLHLHLPLFVLFHLDFQSFSCIMYM